MITKTIEKNGIKWIAVNFLTNEEIEEIEKQIPLNIFIKNELLKPTLHPRVNIFKDCVYVILHFPIFDHGIDISKMQEIDFVIGKNFLITVNYNNFPPIEEFLNRLENRGDLMNHYFNDNAGVLFFHLLQFLYNFSLRELDYVQKKIDKIEEQIFLKKEKEMVEKISVVSRDMIEFSRSIKPHKRIIESYKNFSISFFGSEYETYASEILNEYFNLENLFKSTEETINSLQETNDSLVSIKNNEEMRIISIIAFITFPLMLLSSIFSMNASYIPIIGMYGDFWVILGLMVASISVMYAIFKKKRWI